MIFFKPKKGKRHHHVMLIEDCFSFFIFIFIYIMTLIFYYKKFIIYLNENMINFKHKLGPNILIKIYNQSPAFSSTS